MDKEDNMLVIPYNTEKHWKSMTSLLASRALGFLEMQDLPEHGLIAFDNGFPIAAGFIRRIEGTYAMLDSYITDREAAPEKRNRALDLITAKLVKTCKANGVSAVFTFSNEENIVDRSIRHGFKAIPHKMTIIGF